jgi:hypothetical protein
MAFQRNQLSAKQRQRNLENIQYVRSLLKQKQETDGQLQTRPVDQQMEDSETPDPGEG